MNIQVAIAPNADRHLNGIDRINGINAMPRSNHPNNARLCQLVEGSGLSLAVTLTLFNRGQSRPVTESSFKDWLAAPGSARWREIPDDYLQHAQTVLAPKKEALVLR